MNEAYDISYDIYNHDDPDSHPWGVVMDHDKEKYNEYSPLYRLIYRYKNYEVHKHFGLSLNEFMSLPREYVKLILDILANEAIAHNKAFDKAKEKFKEEFEDT